MSRPALYGLLLLVALFVSACGVLVAGCACQEPADPRVTALTYDEIAAWGSAAEVGCDPEEIAAINSKVAKTIQRVKESERK